MKHFYLIKRFFKQFKKKAQKANCRFVSLWIKWKMMRCTRWNIVSIKTRIKWMKSFWTATTTSKNKSMSYCFTFEYIPFINLPFHLDYWAKNSKPSKLCGRARERGGEENIDWHLPKTDDYTNGLVFAFTLTRMQQHRHPWLLPIVVYSW